MKQLYLEAGQIVSTHGIRGEVKVLPWDDGPEFLTLFDRVYPVSYTHLTLPTILRV